MFIAMNRFKIRPGSEKAFEAIWESRDSHLNEVPGFKEFHLLRGPEAEDYTLYSSHTVWRSKESFDAWTHSEAFKKAHKGAGSHGDVYLEHPQFEGFEVVQASSRAESTA
ncbi:antibiotic biosynthesis monooxygenase family protein [Granulosicoccus antarcticus]|uniref:Heme oxygenase (Staphylobilin-producing) 2 n=1 Tax=Granulosicoccus antarcticus IMCC3135 TaxID=1192854 RepID=A0A2Z2P2M2_9GAMM|nr:antibiotic biosynthesis monooxygenase [Granulosicoccus antarcticus]ASJ76881.1 Heme oxygenase (staphylobilin-producing) 2 [Granulosicoccus antarcticus IMCC3135]